MGIKNVWEKKTGKTKILLRNKERKNIKKCI